MLVDVAQVAVVAAECAVQDRAEVGLNDQSAAIVMRAKEDLRDVRKVVLSREQRDHVQTDQRHASSVRKVVRLLMDHVYVIAVMTLLAAALHPSAVAVGKNANAISGIPI